MKESTIIKLKEILNEPVGVPYIDNEVLTVRFIMHHNGDDNHFQITYKQEGNRTERKDDIESVLIVLRAKCKKRIKT